MPNYLVIHKISRYPESQDEWVDDWQSLRQRSLQNPGCTWLTSFVDSEENLLYCLWEADDEECINSCFTSVESEMAPIINMREIVLFDPTWLDG
jgi:quinol monooxygenase YgiN